MDYLCGHIGKNMVSEKIILQVLAEQRDEIKNYQSKCKYERTREILDFFLFSYYACGLRLSDLLTLEWSNINWEVHTLQKVQFKTKREFDMPIPLTEDALKILERWKGRNKRFVFNLLPEKFNLEDQKKLFMERNAKDKTFNRSLQAVAEAINLPFFPTMHTARHSFAVFAINNGIEIYLLSKLMGHSSVVSTEKTYAEFLKEKEDENQRIFEKPEEDISIYTDNPDEYLSLDLAEFSRAFNLFISKKNFKKETSPYQWLQVLPCLYLQALF